MSATTVTMTVTATYPASGPVPRNMVPARRDDSDHPSDLNIDGSDHLTATPTSTTTTTTVPLQSAGNIVADGDFAMFNQAVTTANMGQALEATDITVLAPSDQAMRDVPNIDAILIDPSLSSQLVQAHLVNGSTTPTRFSLAASTGHRVSLQRVSPRSPVTSGR